MSKLDNLRAQILEIKNSLWFETKANEVEHTLNAGFWAELVPWAVLQNDILSLIPTYSSFLWNMRGNRGSNLPMTIDVVVVWETGFYGAGSEWTTWALLSKVAQGTDKIATSKVTITQKKYIMSIDISDEELKYSIWDIERIAMDRLAKSASRTIDAVILNGDTEAGAINNINKVDWAPTAWIYFLQANGLRKQALITKWVAWVDKIDLGTLDWTDFVNMQTATWDLGANPDDFLWIFNRATFQKSLQLVEFKNANENGANSTIIRGAGALTSVLGSDLHIARDMTKTDATWRISVVWANNTKWQVLYVNKDAVQFWFSWEFTTETVRVPAVWIQIIGYFYFGFWIANQLSGSIDPTVVVGYNVTVS